MSDTPQQPEATDDIETVGNGVCHGCGNEAGLYVTESGLRCGDCRETKSLDLAPTYTPTLRTWENEQAQEMKENTEEFKEQLSDISFCVELQDGTTYEMDKFESHAVLMKFGDEWEAFLKELARKVAEHYEKETEPTKMVDHAPWGTSNHDDAQDSYDSHAELAPVVAYPQLRAALMQLGLQALSGPDGDAPSVIGLGETTITEYRDGATITVSVEDWNEDS